MTLDTAIKETIFLIIFPKNFYETDMNIDQYEYHNKFIYICSLKIKNMIFYFTIIPLESLLSIFQCLNIY
jgi:hypothetical protein